MGGPFRPLSSNRTVRGGGKGGKKGRLVDRMGDQRIRVARQGHSFPSIGSASPKGVRGEREKKRNSAEEGMVGAPLFSGASLIRGAAA